MNAGPIEPPGLPGAGPAPGKPGGSILAQVLMLTSLGTGGAGFIGSHLVEALLARGRRVVVLDDLSTGSMANLERVRDHPHLRIVLDSITNEGRLGEQIDEADEVYHLAAVVGVRLVLEEPGR